MPSCWTSSAFGERRLSSPSCSPAITMDTFHDARQCRVQSEGAAERLPQDAGGKPRLRCCAHELPVLQRAGRDTRWRPHLHCKGQEEEILDEDVEGEGTQRQRTTRRSEHAARSSSLPRRSRASHSCWSLMKCKREEAPGHWRRADTQLRSSSIVAIPGSDLLQGWEFRFKGRGIEWIKRAVCSKKGKLSRAPDLNQPYYVFGAMRNPCPYNLDGEVSIELEKDGPIPVKEMGKKGQQATGRGGRDW
ncbi:hypothetical protein G0U57_011231 [Chelydra serpentina]|uniref:Uncharacterized protein n=1 Tax=Chelydra serpentina TaxID=8475 RepID=A0A8T1T7N3_CHESE|nr:hypothetical protein G0U57_011231 [Chelydra serpentina]